MLFLDFPDFHRISAACGAFLDKFRIMPDLHLADGVCLWIRLVVRVGRIGIERGLIFLARFQEVEGYLGYVSLGACRRPDKPVSGILDPARRSDIFERLGLALFRLAPFHRHILYELERIREPFVVLRKVGSHLQW